MKQAADKEKKTFDVGSSRGLVDVLRETTTASSCSW